MPRSRDRSSLRDLIAQMHEVSAEAIALKAGKSARPD
jgi:hypothetical protein